MKFTLSAGAALGPAGAASMGRMSAQKSPIGCDKQPGVDESEVPEAPLWHWQQGKYTGFSQTRVASFAVGDFLRSEGTFDSLEKHPDWSEKRDL